MVEEPDILSPGKRLRYSLTRGSSRGAQIGCTLLLALALGGGAVALLRTAMRSGDEPNKWVSYVVIGGFLAVALVLVYSAIHQVFALRTRQTIIEVDDRDFRRGARVQMYFRQPGPAKFESLRANLVGEETWWEGCGKDRRHHRKQLGTFNVFDSGPFVADDHMPFERLAIIEVPAELQPTEEGDHSVTWNLEVWGRVRGRADFQHVFPVRIV